MACVNHQTAHSVSGLCGARQPTKVGFALVAAVSNRPTVGLGIT